MYLDRLKKQNMLQVFNLVTTKGKKREGAYELDGIKASHDFDGYTCLLTYHDLNVSLLFHGAYDFQYQDEKTLEDFFKKIAKLLDKH